MILPDEESILSSASFVQGYYEITIIHGLLCKKKSST